jgi:hypothetical protein
VVENGPREDESSFQWEENGVDRRIEEGLGEIGTAESVDIPYWQDERMCNAGTTWIRSQKNHSFWLIHACLLYLVFSNVDVRFCHHFELVPEKEVA